MSLNKYRPLLLLLIVGSFTLSGQDLHFTYFELAPQALNPALNGAFKGTYRISGIYRDQYQNTGVNGFRTIEAGVDAPIIRGLRKQDWIGVGLSMDRDTRGIFDLGDTYTRMGLTYHFAIDPKQNSIISLGVQRMGVARRLNVPAGADITSFLINGAGRNDPDLERLIQRANSGTSGGGGGAPKLETSYSDLVAGLAFSSKNVSSKTTIGLSTARFTNFGSDSIGVYKRPMRLTGFATYEGILNKSMTIEPSLLFQSTGGSVELSAHMLAGVKVKADNPLIAKAGLGFRTGTASAQFIAGADYKGIKAGLSYDLPITGYAGASGIQNAIEFGVSYIGILNKKPKVKPIVVCPRL
jgi:type IX secretion system PorP/SprF family membrane protein